MARDKGKTKDHRGSNPLDLPERYHGDAARPSDALKDTATSVTG
jgi:hypothetical protein